MDRDFIFLFAIVAGFYAIAGAGLNWKWFMEHPKAQVFVRLFGRTGTRVFYILLGISVIILGVFGIFGLPD